MKTPYFIEKIDWTELRNQKKSLLAIIEWNKIPLLNNDLEGIVALIDALQDYAVDEINIDPMHVFDFESEDERDGYTGLKDSFNNPVHEDDKITILCANCNSDNIEIKNWVNPNTDEVGDVASYGDDQDTWCNDCQSHGGVYGTTKLSPDAEIIGYQVVGIENGECDGEIHPDMDASFCIYSLSQANEMLKDNDGSWRLLTIWKGDVEEPTFCFEGNPRD